MKLSQCKFHIEQWQSTKYQHYTVRYKKSTTTILVTDVGKTPHITQINGKANDGQQEFSFLTPRLTPSLCYGND